MSAPLNNNYNFSLKYDYELNSLNVYQDMNQKNVLIGELIEEDFQPKHRINISDFSQKIKCLKIKEKRLRFAEHYPIANGVLSVISCIGIGLLVTPWLVGLLMNSFSGCGLDSPFEGYSKVSHRTWNWIRPVFIKNHLKASIDKDKNNLIETVKIMDGKYTSQYFADLKDLIDQEKKDYGLKGWTTNNTCQKNFNEMERAKKIAKNVFNRDI